MPDVVYILGPPQEEGFEELRYSLRSLRFVPHQGNVWIVGGTPPDWCVGVNHLPVPQHEDYARKRWNQRNNIYQATLCSDISDEFILMNDDFIFLTNTWPIPVIHGGPINEHHRYRDRHPNGYGDLYQWLLAHEYSTLYFSEHRAMVMRKDLMRFVHEEVAHIGDDYPVPTAYGNMAGLEGEWGEDAVFRNKGKIWDAGEYQISTFEKDFLVEPYGELIRFIHPDPSPFEK